MLDIANNWDVSHSYTHICATNHPGFFTKQIALRQHCLLLLVLSPAFQQVCLGTGLQSLPVSLSILTSDLVPQCQANLTERCWSWRFDKFNRTQGLGCENNPPCCLLINLSSVFLKTKHQAHLSVYSPARQTQSMPGCQPPQRVSSTAYSLGFLAAEAVSWERHQRGGRGHDLCFLKSVGHGATCIRDEPWDQTNTPTPECDFRSTILKLKCILT